MVDLKRLAMRVMLFLFIHSSAITYADSPSPLTLTNIAECVRTNNPALKIALAELERARSSLVEATWSRGPSLSISSLFAPLPARKLLKYCVSDQEVGGSPQVLPCPNQDIQDDARLSDTDGMGIFSRTTATLTQPLYTFGKIEHGVKAAEAGISAYQSLSESAARRYDLTAFQAYYGLILTQRARKIIKKGQRHFKKLRRTIQKDLDAEAGKYTTNDLRELTIKESDLIAQASLIDSMHARAIRGIQLSCTLPIGRDIKLAERQLKPLNVDLPPETDLLRRAEVNHPDIRAALAQVDARRAQLDLAVSRFFPDLALVGTFGFARGTSAEDNPDPFANDPFNVLGYGAYLGLSWRLNFAQLRARYLSASAEVTRAEAQLAGLRLQLSIELNERYQEVKRLERLLTAQKEAMRQGKQWVTSTMLNVSAGLVKSQKVIEAIKAFSQTSLVYDRSIYEYNLALVRLWTTSGHDPLTLIPADPIP